MSFPYGNNIRLYIDGESHGERLTMTLEGFPAGLRIDEEHLWAFMKRRAPGQNEWSTGRKEADKPVFLSGVENGATTGGRITAVIYNTNQHSGDYGDAGIIPRPSHADFPAIVKYGSSVDLRGGGHFSGRLTALTCVAGALAIQYLREKGIEIKAHIYSVGGVKDKPFSADCNEGIADGFPVINETAGEEMKTVIKKAKEDLDSVGGVIECAVTGLPVGLGEHLFAGAEGRISSAVFSVPGVKAIEFGNGFRCAELLGSENNDSFYFDGDTVKTYTNNCGGILGGMTNGMPLVFRCALKPTPSIGKEQDTVNLETKENIKYTVKGRHDPCIVPRAVPVIESSAALAVLDMLLDGKSVSLEASREKIDAIDKEIVRLFCERMAVSEDIARYKKENGLPVYVPERENELLGRVKALSKDKFSGYTEELYKEILALSKKYQSAETDEESVG
ncbi:MAG: chorismate synthase [Clostridia bacterium]|nr:chorismate synthase [Clostridia bacterium]